MIVNIILATFSHRWFNVADYSICLFWFDWYSRLSAIQYVSNADIFNWSIESNYLRASKFITLHKAKENTKRVLFKYNLIIMIIYNQTSRLCLPVRKTRKNTYSYVQINRKYILLGSGPFLVKALIVHIHRCARSKSKEGSL